MSCGFALDVPCVDLEKEKVRTGILLAIVLAGLWTSLSLAEWKEGREAFDRGDYTTALKAFHPLAEEGNKDAQAILGYISDNGARNEVPRKYQEAHKWYPLAAENGVAQSQIALGRMYWEGGTFRRSTGPPCGCLSWRRLKAPAEARQAWAPCT